MQRGSQLEGDQRLPVLRQSLRCMQRAWWFDHDLVPIMEDIFPLAFTLDHSGEATRYAILAAEQQTVPKELLQRVASVLAERDEYDRALGLYRKIAAHDDPPPDALTQFEIGRLSLLAGKIEDAAGALAVARDALEKRGEARLSDEDRTRLLRNPEVTYALLGEGFLRAKRLDEAEVMFRRADESKPNPAMLGLRLALIEKERGHREQALQQLDQYFSAKTTSAGMVPCQLLADLLAGEVPPNGADDPSHGPPPAGLLDRLRPWRRMIPTMCSSGTTWPIACGQPHSGRKRKPNTARCWSWNRQPTDIRDWSRFFFVGSSGLRCWHSWEKSWDRPVRCRRWKRVLIRW